MNVVRRAAGIALVAMSALVVPAQHASARAYYNYWSYWHKPPGASSWQYSSVGASGYYLKSGTQVEGWRFAVGNASPSDPQPRPTNVTYDDYCSGKNTDKTYRVLLVVDYGTESGAPGGPVYSCYGFDNDDNGFQVLTQQHTERDANGLICAIDSYPRTGCGDTVSSPAPAKSTTKPAPAHPATTSTTTTSTTTAHSATSPRLPATPAVSRAAQPKPASPTTNADTAAAATPTADQSSTPATLRPFTAATEAARSTFPTGLVIALVALAGLGGGAWFMRRRAG
jgi:hypothetical protein